MSSTSTYLTAVSSSTPAGSRHARLAPGDAAVAPVREEQLVAAADRAQAAVVDRLDAGRGELVARDRGDVEAASARARARHGRERGVDLLPDLVAAAARARPER